MVSSVPLSVKKGSSSIQADINKKGGKDEEAKEGRRPPFISSVLPIFPVSLPVGLAFLPIQSSPEEVQRRITQPTASSKGLDIFFWVCVP